MRSIRKFAYAAVLGLGMLSVQPTLAAAEEPHGVFKLDHEVHWQNCILRRGDYAFTFQTSGPSTILTLRSLNGTGTDAIVLVTEIEAPPQNTASKLVLVSRSGESYVSSMDLPQYDMTLRFTVPPPDSMK